MISAKLTTGGSGFATGYPQKPISDIDRVLSKVRGLIQAMRRVVHPPICWHTLLCSTQRSFYFQKRFGKINLHAINQISIAHVEEEVDIEILQQHLEMIVFGDLEASDAVSDIDESFSKLFRLSQLTVEYLLSVQDVSKYIYNMSALPCKILWRDTDTGLLSFLHRSPLLKCWMWPRSNADLRN